MPAPPGPIVPLERPPKSRSLQATPLDAARRGYPWPRLRSLPGIESESVVAHRRRSARKVSGLAMWFLLWRPLLERGRQWIASPRAGVHDPRWELALSSAATLLALLHWPWMNGAPARPEPVSAEGLTWRRRRSVHAGVRRVAAAHGTRRILRYQSARESPMSACWCPRTVARCRALHPDSISGVGNRPAG
jgi:hypothetical protein